MAYRRTIMPNPSVNRSTVNLSLKFDVGWVIMDNVPPPCPKAVDVAVSVRSNATTTGADEGGGEGDDEYVNDFS